MGVLFLSALIVIAVLALLVSVMVASQRRGHREYGICGRCGYATTGLTSFNCPECGSDLRDVGVIPPRAAGGLNRSTTVTLFVITIVLVLLCSRFAGWTQRVGPAPTTAPTTRSPDATP